MKKKIFFLTSCRSDYGLLKNIILKFSKDLKFKTNLIAIGSHFRSEFGNTFQEIKRDKISIYRKFNYSKKINNAEDVLKAISFYIYKFSDFLKKNKPDLAFILGDRYEVYAFAIACHYHKVPIAHIGGGDVTEGSLDNAIRYNITSLSKFHFVTNKFSEKMLKKKYLKKNVFNFGSPGVEGIKLTKFINKQKLYNRLKIDILKKTILVTFHPATLDQYTTTFQLNQMLKALKKFSNKFQILLTVPNEDQENKLIIKKFEEYKKKYKSFYYFNSLGYTNYLSLLKYASINLGNSSSGVYEAPYLKTPTVNLGNRQKGRLMSNSIITCEPKFKNIVKSIYKALMIKKVKIKPIYKYDQTSKKIHSKVKKILT